MTDTDQILAHAVGDYILQSDWMASEKTRSHLAAAAHAATYSLPFLAFRPGWKRMAVITGTHFLIDRFRLARYVCWAKNYIAPRGQDHELTATGYPADRPAWLSTWLLIITDNILHVLINRIALKGCSHAPSQHPASPQRLPRRYLVSDAVRRGRVRRVPRLGVALWT